MASDIKRYDVVIDRCGFEPSAGMDEHPTGDYVLYDDHRAALDAANARAEEAERANGELRHRLDEASRRRGKTADQLDRVKRSASGTDRALRARIAELEAQLAAAKAEGAAEERAAVVAWLRSELGEPCTAVAPIKRTLRHTSDLIEAGDHRKERGDGE